MSTEQQASTVPADDTARELTLVRPDDSDLTHLVVVGDTYTMLVSGPETAGRYATIDMLIPPGGGPPPHRHNFEESFYVLKGEIEVIFRGETSTVPQGATANIPANAPHSFTNPTDEPVRLLCTVSPSGLEQYFQEFGDLVPDRTTPAPDLSDDEKKKRMDKAIELAPKYGIENRPPE